MIAEERVPPLRVFWTKSAGVLEKTEVALSPGAKECVRV
jgi:hypothetical protein